MYAIDYAYVVTLRQPIVYTTLLHCLARASQQQTGQHQFNAAQHKRTDVLTRRTITTPYSKRDKNNNRNCILVINILVVTGVVAGVTAADTVVAVIGKRSAYKHKYKCICMCMCVCVLLYALPHKHYFHLSLYVSFVCYMHTQRHT